LTKQLAETVRETTTLAGSEQFTNNYLTTRIQALNRAQKTTIKSEAAVAVAGGSDFSKIQSISTSSAIFNGLSRIETDKANETTPQLDKVTTWHAPGTFTQQRITKFGDISQKTLTLRSLDKQYYFAGDVVDNPMLLKLDSETGVYSTANFAAAASQNESPETDQQIFPKTPLTHSLQNTNDTTGAVTTQTTLFRPFITAFDQDEDGPVVSQVGLRLSSLTTAVVQPKNTVDHLTSTAGTYAGTYKGVGSDEALKVFSMTAEHISKEDARIRLTITLTKGSEPAFTLVPTKETGIFELNQGEAGAVATSLSFVSDRLLVNFKDSKGSPQELFIKFTKVTHLASSGLYSISRPGVASQNMDNNSGNPRYLKTSYDSIGITIQQTTLSNDGTFTVSIEGKSIGTNFRFTDNVLSFRHSTGGLAVNTYTVRYTT